MFIVRWRNHSRAKVQEVQLLDKTLRYAVDYATAICDARNVNVAVVENTRLVCIVYPD